LNGYWKLKLKLKSKRKTKIKIVWSEINLTFFFNKKEFQYKLIVNLLFKYYCFICSKSLYIEGSLNSWIEFLVFWIIALHYFFVVFNLNIYLFFSWIIFYFRKRKKKHLFENKFYFKSKQGIKISKIQFVSKFDSWFGKKSIELNYSFLECCSCFYCHCHCIENCLSIF